ncbi:uncharacterized protein LOC111375731 [Olea europaea var. sylvestris]|uniref:uncharacterized protein LOC111375731 n=1 Tax=Olea europaea var. sylvestris TaxID=158386 RepID=UPI000C1D7736|nr:uncharacterized protein LOC111375731 [Olea europaea var. sylvestris]
MAQLNAPLIQKSERILFYFLPISHVLFCLLFLTKLTSVVNRICIWDLGIFLFFSMILTLINWVLIKLPNVVSENVGFVILGLPIVVVNTIVFKMVRNSEQFYQIFAYGGLILMLSARLSSDNDSLFILRSLVFQYESFSITYFLDSKDDLHITKGLWMFAVFIIGLCVHVFPHHDAKLAVKFLLLLVPQKFCPPIAQ